MITTGAAQAHVVIIKNMEKSNKHKLNSMYLPHVVLAKLLKNVTGSFPLRIQRKRQTQLNLYFASKCAAEKCKSKWNNMLMNGVTVSVEVQYQSVTLDPFPNSNWIRIYGVNHSVNEQQIMKHIRKYIDSAVSNQIVIQSTTDEMEPMVDVECTSREYAKLCVERLRMTVMDGMEIWVENRDRSKRTRKTLLKMKVSKKTEKGELTRTLLKSFKKMSMGKVQVMVSDGERSNKKIKNGFARKKKRWKRKSKKKHKS